jgi:putative ABC transport system permease protein
MRSQGEPMQQVTVLPNLGAKDDGRSRTRHRRPARRRLARQSLAALLRAVGQAGSNVRTAVHLALSEVWRNRGRFLLFSMVVALITILVLFIAALGTGLLGGIREYLQQVNADLLVYQETARRDASASRLSWSTRPSIARIEGVRDVGAVAFSSATIVDEQGRELLDVSLIGVEPGKPGEPPAVAGRGLQRRTAYEAVVDQNVIRTLDVQPGERVIVRTIQGRDKEVHELEIVGASDSLKYSLSPSIFVPIAAWDEVRPQGTAPSGAGELSYNVAAVQLEDPAQLTVMQRRLEAQVSSVEAIDRTAAYESLPGYSSIRTSLETQRIFVLLIGTLVIGGFFQIQTLQKVPQIGTLKALGTPNGTIALAAVVQILTVILTGLALGSLISYGLSTLLPANIPIVFELRTGAIALGSILALGLLGGLVSVRYSLRVEPLIALGLNS